jgi:hypothetical protein
VRTTGQKSAWVDETVNPGNASPCAPVTIGTVRAGDTGKGTDYPSLVLTMRGKGLTIA